MSIQACQGNYMPHVTAFDWI